ncbi:MAG TPA: hypothetical protein VF047_03680 [Nitrososphaeraceae archaeon]
MFNNIKKRTDLLTPQLLKTPTGQQVIYEFLKSLSEEYSLEDALEKAKIIAQKGSLLPFQISFILDLLNILGPVVIQFFSDSKRSKLKD